MKSGKKLVLKVLKKMKPGRVITKSGEPDKRYTWYFLYYKKLYPIKELYEKIIKSNDTASFHTSVPKNFLLREFGEKHIKNY